MNYDTVINFIVSIAAIVIIFGFVSIALFGVYGLLTLTTLPLFLILKLKRVEKWLDSLEVKA